VKQLAGMMLKLALAYPEYRPSAAQSEGWSPRRREVLRQGLPGRAEPGAQITNTMRDLGWRPRVNMQRALKRIFDA